MFSAGRSSVYGLWRRHGWLVIGLLWLIALALGLLGFALNAPVSERSPRLPDIAYRTLQLIPMNSGDVDGATWPLDVARFLVPFLAAWTAVRAFLGLFRDRWQQALIRFWRDHVVICGLSRKGWLLAQSFAARGERVVVIEADESHDLIGPCRERGIPVLIGDAANPDLLARAGALRSHHVVAVTDDDGINAEIFVRCHALLRAGKTGRTNGLTCTVHLVDPELYELARTREMALEEGVPLRLELFNVFDRGARLLWSRYGPPDAWPAATAGHADADASCSYHALVVGLGRLGESLIVTAGRDWHTRLHDSPCGAQGRLRFTVVDEEAGRKCLALHLRYPQLAAVCDLVPHTLNVSWPEFYAAEFLDASPALPISAAFICFDDDSLGLRTGLTLHQQLLKRGAAGTPVVVRMAESGGLARLVDPDGDDVDPVFADLHPFPLLDRTCTPQAILGGTHEILARGLHEAYLQQQRALGHTAESNPAAVEWEALPAGLRESNRAEAGGIMRHLGELGYALAPLTDWNAAFFRFPEEQVVRLAEREHERYLQERTAQDWGYTAGAKDLKKKRTRGMKPWGELAEAERKKTCDAIRELPAVLARAGFQINAPSAMRDAAGASEPAQEGPP